MMLPVGIENFEEIIRNKLDFVDKTLFIKEIFDDRATKAIVFTRPRRFGKTFNLSMLHHFLAAEVYGQSTKGLFDNLKISQCGDNYMQHQGQYPVISISLKNIDASSFQAAMADIAKSFSQLYQEHPYLLTSTKLSPQQQKNVEIISAESANEAQLKSALHDLTHYLYLHHGTKPWLLIDEYDTPIQKAYAKNYYDDMIDFMRGLFGVALKTNPYIEKAVITGILRIAKESLFSGVNNLKVYSILNAKYSEYFGFTEAEVSEVLDKANLTGKAAEIKTWYNGYQFGETVIYNPWSIANCIQENGNTKPYWVNTSDNQLIKDLLKASPLSFKKDFGALMHGETRDKIIDEQMVFQYLNHNMDAVWSLLLMAGYLKSVSSEETAQGTLCALAIPNQEVRNLYRHIVEQWLSNGHGINWYNEFIAALINGDIDNFKKHLENVILQITSYHDFAKEPEAFYHGLMLGFTVSLYSTGEYDIKSNRESGLGRFDIILIPQDKSKLGIILELKVAKENESLQDAAKNALQQIHDKKYVAEIQSRGIEESVKIGIGFHNKEFELCYEQG